MSNRDREFDELIHRVASQSHALDATTRNQHLSMLSSLTTSTETAMPTTALPARQARRGRRARSVVIATAAVFTVSGVGVGTAAAFGVFSSPPTERGIAHCYATADLSDPGNHTDFMLAVGSDSRLLEDPDGDGVGDAAAVAFEVCSGGWAQGRFQSTDPKVSDPNPVRTDFPVPELVACVLADGSIGVFPGDARTCAALDLPQAALNG